MRINANTIIMKYFLPRECCVGLKINNEHQKVYKVRLMQHEKAEKARISTYARPAGTWGSSRVPLFLTLDE